MASCRLPPLRPRPPYGPPAVAGYDSSQARTDDPCHCRQAYLQSASHQFTVSRVNRGVRSCHGPFLPPRTSPILEIVIPRSRSITVSQPYARWGRFRGAGFREKMERQMAQMTRG